MRKMAVANSRPVQLVWKVIKRLFRIDRHRNQRFFNYDAARFWKFSGAWRSYAREARLAAIIMGYHIIEKGLTMPNRRLGFGQGALEDLMVKIQKFVAEFGDEDPQLRHAVGVVKAYWTLHVQEGFDFGEGSAFASKGRVFVESFGSIPEADEIQSSREDFYREKESAFPVFAAARHTVRHYIPGRTVPIEKIRRAVALAQTAPSACNRQHVRVYCIEDHTLCQKVLSLQGGNRGFGQDADKVLIVVADLADVLSMRERNDGYVEGGIFLMNLCYGLFYEEVAHCILTWSQPPETDMELRRMVAVKDSEVVVALLACGEAPEQFSVARSPRKQVDSIFRRVGAK